MSGSNGVIRIGRKGTKKFAFGDGPEFSVDVVEAFQEWVAIDDKFRNMDHDGDGVADYDGGQVHLEDMPAYHSAAVEFVNKVCSGAAKNVTKAEALDFIARLREQYDEVADFFVPRSRKKQELQDTSETVSVQFSEEPGEN